MKSGILTPILKKGKDKNIPGNYRGIIGIFVLVEVDIM
jgi:hypothetical protein